MSPHEGRPATVSIVIPCRNADPFITELLDSLLAQTVRPDEVVVVDDRSTDGSLAAVADWQRRHVGSKPLVRMIEASPPGLHNALNMGFRVSSGEFLGCVGADDLLHPNYVERLVEALMTAPDASYAYPAMRLFGDASGRYPTMPFNPARLVLEGNFVCAGALMRRQAFERSDGFADLPAWEDWDFWLSLLDRGLTGVLVDSELYLWRRHGQTRNQLSTAARRLLRLRIWARHPRLVLRYLIPGLPHALRRVIRPQRQQ